ncbi:hypothetical protein B0J14DRAFT_666762 [Halenospora varia]|nr:hypothetical protein B0J14DRAFT_666762 [Halenospora varia]
MQFFTLTTLLLLPTTILATPGGPCSAANGWGKDCICLDKSVCTSSRYNGIAYTGTGPSNWPCPSDADNILGCVVKDCPGQAASTQCLWRDGCSSINGVVVILSAATTVGNTKLAKSCGPLDFPSMTRVKQQWNKWKWRVWR